MKTKAEWAELSKQFEKEYDETDNEICYRLHLLCTLLSLDNTDTDNINKFEEDYDSAAGKPTSSDVGLKQP